MKWFKNLIVVIILSLILMPSYVQSLIPNTVQATTSKDLGIQPIFQHKDTKMLCLRGCPLYGGHAWDVVHEVSSSDDVDSCNHCRWYCVVASIAMIASYFGGNLRQDRITNYIYREVYHQNPERDLAHGIGFSVDMATEALSWTLNRAEISKVTYMLTFDEIRDLINSGRPIVRYGIHFTVIDGYNTDGQLVHVINPWYGTETAIPYNELGVQGSLVPPANATARNDEPELWMDSDSDGVVDFDEINRFFTDPYNDDTDGDLVPDKAEIRSYTFLSDDSFDEEDVRKPDPDNDGLRAELDWDSDNGGCPDGLEDLNRNGRVDAGETDPLNPADDPQLSPVADFEYSPQTPRITQPVTFNATASYDPDGTIISYEWNFDDGNTTTVTDPIITHAFYAPGDYSVSLTVTDNHGLNDTYTTLIEVKLCDVNDDGKVNVYDLAYLGKAWLTMVGDPDYNAAVDFNSDGKIDYVDHHLLQVSWRYTS